MAERVGPARRILQRFASAGLEAASRARILRHRGSLAVRGLAARAEIRFDQHGVPHIRGETDADGFVAHGVCHAIDRFFQMDMMRRVLRGRLAETVGERPLSQQTYDLLPANGTTTDADRFVRNLDLARAARRYLATAGEEDRHLLQAYVDGVNAGVALLRRRRPLEHAFLRLPLEDWTLEDSVLIIKSMALALSFKWRTAPVFQAIADRLSTREALWQGILPRAPQPGEEALAHVVVSGIEGALAFLPGPERAQGSNAFVVGGGRSRSGLPLLASDPHLEFSLPSVWYLSALQGPGYRTVGCSLPGLPGIAIGRTPSLAWGLTNGMIDDADYWAEELDGTGTRYRVDGRWRPLKIETQEIRRRGKTPVLLRLRRTHRGPLLSDAVPAWTGAPISLRLSMHDAAEDLQSFLRVGRARRAADIPAAIAGFGAPAQNILYADAEGGGGSRLMGRVPARPAGVGTPVTLLDGRTSDTDWTGWIPADELPALDLRPQDALVSANQPQVAGAYPHYLSHLYEPPYRAQRIRACLAGREDLGVDDLAAIQMDVVNVATEWFRDRVLVPHAEAVRKTRPGLARLIARLIAWDGTERTDAVGPVLWHLTYHHLLRRVFGPVLGAPLLERWLGMLNMVDAPLRRAFEDPDSPWAPPESRAALVARALEDTERDLAARGLGVEATWGDLHTLTLKHPLSVVPVVGEAFSRGPMPLRGSSFVPAAGQYSHRRPARVVAGTSYRQVVDLADPERTSGMITFGGQSGYLGSPHYDDLTELWYAGDFLPMPLEEAPATADVLVLTPR